MFVTGLGDFAAAANTSDSEAAYTQEITKRADKIVAPLGITDEAAKARVRDLIVQQYRSLARDSSSARCANSEVKQGRLPIRTSLKPGSKRPATRRISN